MESDFAVINRGEDEVSSPFEGSEDEVLTWLRKHSWVGSYEVYSRVDKTYTNASDFLLKRETKTMTSEEKMRHEDLMDPVVHARNEMVRQWVARAIRQSKEPNCIPEFLVNDTAYEIIRLFY